MTLARSSAMGCGKLSEDEVMFAEGGANCHSCEEATATSIVTKATIRLTAATKASASATTKPRSPEHAIGKSLSNVSQAPHPNEQGDYVMASPSENTSQSPALRGMTESGPALHAAIVAGHLQTVQAYIDRHVTEGSTRSRPSSGLGAMLAAAGVGPEMQSAAGVALEVRDWRGRTPLHTACLHRRNDIVKALLTGGANANSKDRDGFCPLHRCAQAGSVDTARILLAPRAKGTMMATAHVNVPARKGEYSPLHLACLAGSADMAMLLLRHGAEVSATDKWGCTPLHRACLEGHLEAARAVLDAGAEFDAKDTWKCTPLHRACQNGDVSLLELLVERGASLFAKDDQMERPGQTFREHVSEPRRQIIKDALAAAGNRKRAERHGVTRSGPGWGRAISADVATSFMSSTVRYVPPAVRAAASMTSLGNKGPDDRREGDVAPAVQPWRRSSKWIGQSGEGGPDVSGDGRAMERVTD